MGHPNYYPIPQPPCPLSDPANLHKLCWRSDPPISICFACKGQQHPEEQGYYYYYCATCDLEFHSDCYYHPPEITHPFHPIHPLTLTSDSQHYDPRSFVDGRHRGSDANHQKCKFCRKNLDDQEPYYHCSICNFSLHAGCTINPPPLTVENLKTHHHTLTLFPRRVPLPCDACGFSLDTPSCFPFGATNDLVYSCLLCNYMVHRSCIYLPRVIKITRHQHRLSHTSSLVPSSSGELFSCGVCRKAADVTYGQYSCNKGCHYAVHSKCATMFVVWDGKDLEGVPEEEEEVLEPFVRIDEETIQHFSHEHHHLKILGNDNRGNHENKFCQACILPITVSDRFYSCVHCDFVLHETCASLPRKKHHPIHRHPLTLFHLFSPNPHEPVLDYYTHCFFWCDGCRQPGCAFMYKCTEKDCDFELDVKCASLPDPLIRDCHPHDHPLYFNFTRGECMVCKYYCSSQYLQCIECNSFLGLRCATLPSLAHYKHDKHPLALCCEEEDTTDLKYWCEICETKLDATKWFYKCDSCLVTLHVRCLLGNSMYMKPNHIINIRDCDKTEIARNSCTTRPMCDHCRRRCVDTLVFKWLNRTFCSFNCVRNSQDRRREEEHRGAERQ